MKTTINHFSFNQSGYGHYNVTYKSPVTSKTWSTIISDMKLIDATKNADNAKQSDLNRLKRIVKN